MIWPALFIIISVVTYRIGLWLGSGHKSRVSTRTAVIVLLAIIVLARVIH